MKAGELPENADAKLRQVEERVGIDPGGWSMAGQPLFHPSPEMSEALEAATRTLQLAMQSDDAEKVRSVTAKMAAVAR